MAKPKIPTFELFHAIRSVTEAFERLEMRLKILRRKRLIHPRIWREDVLAARAALTNVIEEAWRQLHKKASLRDFPQLISEEDVKQQFGISQKTLYRRRRKRELPYVKDKDGMIWYPLYDLLDYVLKAKSTSHKPGRPRKF